MKDTTKNWVALFATNFLSILNDNFLKHCLIFVGVTWALPHWMSQSQLISMVSAALVLPYLLFSPLAGRLSVVHSKQTLLRLCKFLEIIILVVAATAFLFESVWLALFSVLIMGVLSCLYSPAKYGLISDVQGLEGVSFGSGVFETMAFTGILAGTVGASYVSDHYKVSVVVALLLGIGVSGYFTSRRLAIKEMPEDKTAAPTTNPIRFAIHSFNFAKKHRYVNSGVLGASIFWLIGGMVQMNLVVHCVKTLGTSNTTAGLVMACAAIGIALGCTTAGVIAGKGLKPQLIPIGLVGMMLSLMLIVVFNPPVVLCACLVFVLAFMGGIFEVPCLSIVQRANVGRELGNLIAYLNFITFLFVLLGTGLFSVTTLLTHDSSLAVFGVILLICAGMFLFYLVKYPEFFRKTINP